MLAARLSPHLKTILMLDAATAFGFGFGCILFAGVLESLLDIPLVWSLYGGAICLVFAALIALVVTRAPIPAGGVWLIVFINLFWGVASIASVVLEWMEPSFPGKIFVIGQGVVVLAMAEIQIFAQCGQRALQTAV